MRPQILSFRTVPDRYYVIPPEPLSYKLKNSEGDDENQDSDLMMSKLCVEPSHTIILSVLY